ncbi:BatD family protein [Spirosoma sp. KUDC1026]|nr:BatD family protein [Spirosoma sp. KUDC1026]
MSTKLVLLALIVVLFILGAGRVVGQSVDNVPVIEFGETTFPIERPFTISVIIPSSETRPSIAFPDIPSFTKKGISASVTTSEINGKTVTSQVITQNYQARAAGQFQLPPFRLTINDEVIRSEGVTLTVKGSVAASQPTPTTAVAPITPPAGAAFLTLRPSKNDIYTGEGVALTLSFFVADNYPYILDFTALDRQLQNITKKIRPVNAWEENLNISELKPVNIQIGGKKFREYRLYQAVFFPLANRSIRIPAVALQLNRRPIIGPPAAQPETISFSSTPLTINVKALPPHPLRGRVAIGTFRLEESLERQRVQVGQSVRYRFGIAGEGNIATLTAPTLVNETDNADIFPPEERQVINRQGDRVTGRKTFTYFIVPHQNGVIPLANRFQWIFFDPQSQRYDTLQPGLRLRVGAGGQDSAADSAATLGSTSQNTNPGSIYTGLAQLDSTDQPISTAAIIRIIANVLIVFMLLGMIFVFYRK